MKLCKAMVMMLLLVSIGFGVGCGKQGEFREEVSKFNKAPKLSVFIKETGKKQEMDLEEYLVGVVAGEMNPNWPLEAYGAQAIVARTFTMEFLARGGTQKLHGTDISTDETEAQAYNPANITDTIREAVKKTRGMVLAHDGRYIKGWYSASCGGLTAYAKEGLGFKEEEPAYITSVESAEESAMPEEEFYWQTTLTGDEINRALKQLGQPEIGTVEKMEIAKRGPTNRAVLLKFTGSAGSTEVVGADFRVAYDPQKLRSIWISDEIVNQPGAIVVKGRGFGHGVGLSQWGAYAYAKKGWSAEEIVKHFYPKAELTTIW